MWSHEGWGQDALGGGAQGVTRPTDSPLGSLFAGAGFPSADLAEAPEYLRTFQSNKYFSL